MGKKKNKRNKHYVKFDILSNVFIPLLQKKKRNKKKNKQTNKQQQHILKLSHNSDFLAARSGAKLSDKIVEVIIKNTRVQYERS
jgi:hypothetical protein